MHVDARYLIHPQDLVVMEVRLFDPAVLH
jgi:hypothetical protein